VGASGERGNSHFVSIEITKFLDQLKENKFLVRRLLHGISEKTCKRPCSGKRIAGFVALEQNLRLSTETF
jgi:hypothetical protein